MGHKMAFQVGNYTWNYITNQMVGDTFGMFWKVSEATILRENDSYIYALVPALQMFSDCHRCKEREREREREEENIAILFAELCPINKIRKKLWTLLQLMFSPKNLQQNIDWPTEVRIGLEPFRRYFFLLRFASLVPMFNYVHRAPCYRYRVQRDVFGMV